MATYLRFTHRLDIYSKTSTVGSSGQRRPTWTATTIGAQCIYGPIYSSIRLNPTIEETDTYKIVLPKGTDIDYGSRVYNVRDRYGNLIDAGPLEVRSILKQQSFSGKIRHLSLMVRRVIE